MINIAHNSVIQKKQRAMGKGAQAAGRGMTLFCGFYCMQSSQCMKTSYIDYD